MSIFRKLRISKTCSLLTTTSQLIIEYFLPTNHKTAVNKIWQLLPRTHTGNRCYITVILNTFCVQSNRTLMHHSAIKDPTYDLFSKNYGFSNFSGSQRMIHITSSCLNKEKSKKFPERPTPNILYYQSPVVWLKNKWKIRKLKNTWDPEFDQNEFTRGTKQAVSVITQMISSGNLHSLNDLIVRHELLRIRRDVKLLWRYEVVENIGVQPDQIKLAIPINIHLNEDAGIHLCLIDMFFVALKWLGSGDLLAIHYVTRFFRNYSDHFKPEWTVSKFYVKRYHVRRIQLRQR